MALGATRPYESGSEEPGFRITLGVVRRVTLDAVDAEAHVEQLLVVKCLAIEAFAFFPKALVALTTVGVQEWPVILGIKPDVIHQDSFSRSASYGVLPLRAPPSGDGPP